MDPLSALAVATSVATFVDFGFKLLRETKDIYDSISGRSARNIQLSSIADYLLKLSSDVEEKSKPLEHVRSMDSLDIIIQSCRECKEVSGELQDALRSLQAEGFRGFDRAVSSFAVVIKNAWNAKKIARIAERLNDIKARMWAAIVVYLWLVRVALQSSFYANSTLGVGQKQGRLENI